MAERKLIPAEAVLEVSGKTHIKATFVQRAGLPPAAGVGSIIALVRVGVVIFLYPHYPQMIGVEVLKQYQTDAKGALDQCKELSGVAVKSAQKLFQTIVTQALLPVFTAILGYIFAKGERAPDS